MNNLHKQEAAGAELEGAWILEITKCEIQTFAFSNKSWEMKKNKSQETEQRIKQHKIQIYNPKLKMQ